MTQNPILVDRAIRTLSRAAGTLYSSLLGAPRPSQAIEELETRTMMSGVGTSMFTMGRVHTSQTHGAVVVAASTTIAAPSSVSATSAGSNTVVVHWKSTSSLSGYNILRSTDGKSFAAIANVSGGSTNSFTDVSVAPHKAYWYKVQAVSGSRGSALSSGASVTTAPAAPTGLVASNSGSGVRLTWADSNGSGVGYLVLRATEGGQYTTIAQLKAGSSKSYTDASTAAATSYIYVVEAMAGSQVSGASNPEGVTTPAQTAAITSRYGSELIVTSNGADTISIAQVGAILNIVMNGQLFAEQIFSAGLFIYDRAGNDTITIDRTVSVRTTITSLGGGNDTVVSHGSNVSAWIDTTDAFSGSGTVHKIGTLAGNVSKDFGASLSNPSDAGTPFQPSASLWGRQPGG